MTTIPLGAWLIAGSILFHGGIDSESPAGLMAGVMGIVCFIVVLIGLLASVIA